MYMNHDLFCSDTRHLYLDFTTLILIYYNGEGEKESENGWEVMVICILL